ncbi:hypothetical protein [Frigidibacter sp. MR17.24]|uniref:hypothetical protein n=1 Tax=Frigidibacter sp. MR17.24 TaxID=3127345 RepID=UPI003012DF70
MTTSKTEQQQGQQPAPTTAQQQGTATPRPQAGQTASGGQMGGSGSTQFTDWASI